MFVRVLSCQRFQEAVEWPCLYRWVFQPRQHLHNGVEEKWWEANILRHQPLEEKKEIKVSEQAKGSTSVDSEYVGMSRLCAW